MEAKHLLFAIGLGLLLPTALFAQNDCGVPYSIKDRATIKSILVGVDPVSGVGDILVRMNQLAVQSATNTYSSVQRSALQYEYQALLEEITRIGDEGASTLSRRSLSWLSRIVDPAFLGLSETVLQAPNNTDEDDQNLSANTAEAVTQALQKMWSCF